METINTDVRLPEYCSGLSASETAARFEALQRKLIPLWNSFTMENKAEQTVVVVPSMTMPNLNWRASVVQAYEERFLFLLLLLRQPRLRLIYVTSQKILPSIIDYYLELLPGVIPSHAKPRLFLVCPFDGTSRPLSEKLLERPRLLERIRNLIPNRNMAHLVPFNTTELERDLALRLGIPMYGADPKFFFFGTKSGCRRLFAEEGLPYALGSENLYSLTDILKGIVQIRETKSDVAQVLVKLNEGVSGEGNALVDLRELPASGHPEERRAIEARVRGMRFELGSETFDAYMTKLGQNGGIVEERISGDEFRSPSVQLRVTPLGEVELLSTHDQLLGGPTGQSYLGARFPADTDYAALITREAAKIGKRLAKEGVIGRFAIDFVVVRSAGGSWHPYAIELNLRKGGTTHPFLTLKFLTDGNYDTESAVFTAPSGRAKYFVASDHVESPLYTSLVPDDLFDLIVRNGLHFDQSRQTGVVFHMMSALSENGRVGLTAVGDSHQEAGEIYERTVRDLNAEAEAALKDQGYPEI